MELFVFLQMGGELHRVQALALPGKDVHRELSTFDAAKATCFKPEDRQRLLGIIESAYGDFASFNGKVCPQGVPARSARTERSGYSTPPSPSISLTSLAYPFSTAPLCQVRSIFMKRSTTKQLTHTQLGTAGAPALGSAGSVVTITQTA